MEDNTKISLLLRIINHTTEGLGSLTNLIRQSAVFINNFINKDSTDLIYFIPFAGIILSGIEELTSLIINMIPDKNNKEVDQETEIQDKKEEEYNLKKIISIAMNLITLCLLISLIFFPIQLALPFIIISVAKQVFNIKFNYENYKKLNEEPGFGLQKVQEKKVLFYNGCVKAIINLITIIELIMTFLGYIHPTFNLYFMLGIAILSIVNYSYKEINLFYIIPSNNYNDDKLQYTHQKKEFIHEESNNSETFLIETKHKATTNNQPGFNNDDISKIEKSENHVFLDDHIKDQKEKNKSNDNHSLIKKIISELEIQQKREESDDKTMHI